MLMRRFIRRWFCCRTTHLTDKHLFRLRGNIRVVLNLLDTAFQTRLFFLSRLLKRWFVPIFGIRAPELSCGKSTKHAYGDDKTDYTSSDFHPPYLVRGRGVPAGGGGSFIHAPDEDIAVPI